MIGDILNKKVFVVDIEAKGFLEKVNSWEDFYILSYGVKEEGSWRIGSVRNVNAIKRLFENPNHIIIGHFFLGYDIRVLKKLIPDMQVKAFIIDTLPLSHYLFNERLKHGLEDWGETVGFSKVKISDDEWENLDYETAKSRCEQDVLINALVWDRMETMLVDLYAPDMRSLLGCIKRANFKMELLVIQEENKILLDVEKCEKNLSYLQSIIDEKTDELKKILPKIPVKVTKKKPNKLFVKSGALSKAGEEWQKITERLGIPLETDCEVDVTVRYDEPNPSSNNQIKDFLFSKGWKPKIFKEGANGKVPQLRDDNKNLCSSILKLIEDVPELEALQGLSVAQHRAGYLKAFLETKDENNYIKASWSGMAKTWRVKHIKPIVNLPSNNSQYGDLVRSCLIAPEGKVFVNADMSSLEDKTKQVCIYPYDPDYVETLNVKGYDAHLKIALLGGFMDEEDVAFYKWYGNKEGECPAKYNSLSDEERTSEYKRLSKVRKSSKVTNYSATYGASSKKISEAADIPLKEAEKLKDAYWELNWSVKKFAEDLKVKTVNGKDFIYNPYTKLWLYLTSDHIKFSACNQNFGACVFDLFLFYLIDAGVKPIMTIHDELSFYIDEGKEEETKEVIRVAIDKVNEVMKLPIKFESEPEFAKSYGDLH